MSRDDMGSTQSASEVSPVDATPRPQASAADSATPVQPRPGDSVGRYTIRALLGAGAMGEVFLATDAELDRTVALKILRPGDMEGGERRRMRFAREAQALARLRHPNVVAVHDVGSASGSDFIAMEHIDGRTLAEVLEEGRLDWRSILELFVGAGRGLAAAHGRGIVHRDFKPHNVMVDGDGRARVGDFGLARLIHGGESASDAGADEPGPQGGGVLDATLTADGSLVGTLHYMAPEQRRREPATAKSDQYAFCLALWEAVCGAAPPERRRAAPRWLVRALERGLAPDPEARHASMADLVVVLERTPIRRRRWASTAAAALGAILVAGAVAIVTLTVALRQARALRARSEAERQRAELTAYELMLLQATSSLENEPTLTLAWLKRYLDAGGFDTPRTRDLAASAAARGFSSAVYRTGVDSFRVTLGPDGHTLAMAGYEARHVALVDLTTGKQRDLAAQPARLSDVAFSPDGKKVVSTSWDGTVLLWDLASGRAEELARGAGFMMTVAYAPTGRRIAWTRGRHVEVWTDGAAGLRVLDDHPEDMTQILFLPDGERLLSLGGDLRLWDLAAGTSRVLLAPPRALVHMALASDGRTLAIGGYEGVVELVDLATSAVTRLGEKGDPIMRVRFSPDGKHVAAASQATILIRSRAGALEREIRVASRNGLIEYSASGDFLAAADADSIVLTWLDGHATRLDQRRLTDHMLAMPDGQLASITLAGDVWIWALEAPKQSFANGRNVEDFDVSPDRKWIAWAEGGAVQLADLAAGSARRLGPYGGRVTALGFSPTNDAVFTVGTDDTLRRFAVGEGVAKVHPLPAAVRSFSVSSDGKRVAYPYQQRFAVAVWTPGDDRTVEHPRRSFAWGLDFSPDGRSLLSYGNVPQRTIWDLETGEERELDAGDTRGVAAFSADGRSVYYTTETGKVGRFDVATGRREPMIDVGSESPGLAVDPSGRFLAVAGSRIDLIDLATGTDETLPAARNLFVGRGGRLLLYRDAPTDAVVVKDRQLGSVWEIRPGGHVTGAVMPEPYEDVVVSSDIGGIGVWRRRAGVPVERDALRRWLDNATSVILDDKLLPTTPRRR